MSIKPSLYTDLVKTPEWMDLRYVGSLSNKLYLVFGCG